jgi:hypothetical protein
MELIPKSIQDSIPKLYETQDVENPLVYLKLFTPDANWSWFVTELSLDKDTCFGLVVSPFVESGEMGYFSLNELKTVRGKLGLPIERDEWFKPKKLADVKKDL